MKKHTTHSEQELRDKIADLCLQLSTGITTSKNAIKEITDLIQSEREKVLEDGIEKIKKLESMRWGLASESPTPVWVKLNDVLAKLAQKEKSK